MTTMFTQENINYLLEHTPSQGGYLPVVGEKNIIFHTPKGTFTIEKMAPKGDDCIKVTLPVNWGINVQVAYYRKGEYAAEDIVKVAMGEKDELEDYMVLKGDPSMFGPDDAEWLKEGMPSVCEVYQLHGSYIVSAPRRRYVVVNRLDGISVTTRDGAGLVCDSATFDNSVKAREAIFSDYCHGHRGLNN